MQLAQRPLRIGLVGYGFMGRAHSNAYKRVCDFFDVEYRPVLQSICGRDRTKASEFAARWGFESIETDWKALIERQDIDVIDIAAPNDAHAAIAVAAAQAGKIILCEKPLARSVDEAEQMVQAVERGHVANMVWYNYRRVPAITLAKQLIDEGRLGRLFHYRSKFLQDLDHFSRRSAGRSSSVEIGRQNREERSYRRPSRALR
jgi:predicted dehydrogenase